LGKINLHLGEVSKLLLSPDGKFVISAAHDGTIFLMTMTDLSSEPIPGIMSPPSNKESLNSGGTLASQKLSSLQNSDVKGSSLITGSHPTLTPEEQLTEIVLVKKSLMESWRKR
jgi:WD40 repeat protein